MNKSQVDNQYWKAILILIFAFFMLAIFDYFPYPESFWLHGLMFGGLIALVYFSFRNDISESLALFLATVVLFYFGLEDLIFYGIGLIMGNPIPTTMPHLNQHGIINLFAMGGDVTIMSIGISVAVGAGIAGGILYLLRRFF